jgi:hypothetical protein
MPDMIRRQRTKKKRGMITGCIRDDNEMITGCSRKGDCKTLKMNGIWKIQNKRQKERQKERTPQELSISKARSRFAAVRAAVAERAVDLSKMSADQQAFAAQKDTPNGKKSCIFEGTDTALPSHLENMFASSGTYRQRRVFFVQPNGFWIKCAYRSFYTSINAPYVHFIRKI